MGKKVWKRIDWKGPYESWDLLMFCMPKDMHCFFHSILFAVSSSYIKKMLADDHISMKNMAIALRKSLANELYQEIHGIRKYDLINGGALKDISKELPMYSIESMYHTLSREELIGPEFFDFVSDEINKDILILHWETKKVYKTMDEENRLKGRKTIVLIYIDHIHYNILAIKNKNDIHRVFQPDHPFILFLKSQLV